MQKPRIVESLQGDTKPPEENATLRAVVRKALLDVLADSAASAAAKASAGRTLLEYFGEENTTGKSRGADMDEAELNDTIARLGTRLGTKRQ